MTTLQEQARRHVEAVEATQQHLEELHRTGGAPHRVAQAYDTIRQGLKLAEVYAHLAIGDQLEQLNTTITDWLTEADHNEPTTPDAVVAHLRPVPES